MEGRGGTGELRSLQEDHGAAYVELDDRAVVDHYGRPERAHQAVRNGVGVIERPVDVLVVAGDDRVEYVDNVLSNRVPTESGGTYAFLLDPNGRIRLDVYVLVAEDRLLLLVPPGRGEALAEEWQERIFIQDVTLEVATDDYVLFTVSGPSATEKLASVTTEPIPEERFTVGQAAMEDAGVTIVPTDGVTGEETYDVVCAAYDADVVLETLLHRGLNAIPFGRRSWNSLTLEAGTPLLAPDMIDELPNVTGVRGALDFEKGCYVGQEVVSRIENRGAPNERLVGLTADAMPAEDADIRRDGESIGRVTRTAYGPTVDAPIALGYVPYAFDADEVTVGDGVNASVTALPFVEGSERSARCPTYPE